MSNAFADKFRAVVGQYVPLDIDALKTLCVKGNDRFWGVSHLDVLAELAGIADGDPIIEDLRIPYVLFSAHYFLLDAAVDGHLNDQRDMLYLTHLLFLTHSLLFQVVLGRIGNQAHQELAALIGRRISDNARAIWKETERRQGLYKVTGDDYEVIVGRSNSTLLFYEILCLIREGEARTDVLKLLSDLVYYMQLGDDLGDWQEDFQRHNLTPLLQECLTRLPEAKQNDVREVEEQLLISGIYESYTANLVNNLEKIAMAFRDLEGISTTRVNAFVQDARNKAYSLLSNMVATKLSYVSDELL